MHTTKIVKKNTLSMVYKKTILQGPSELNGEEPPEWKTITTCNYILSFVCVLVWISVIVLGVYSLVGL